jgi:3',5'-cyclic AMP phosphodiesterase CpdA
MRRIVHISDLHFGRVNLALIEPLLASIVGLNPTVVAVSGDLTQRATIEQFEAAREFLRQIPFPQVVVPGNHDISFWNIYRRFARPLERYRRYINAEVEPNYFDDQLFVLGLNTARSLAWKEGRISERQIDRLRDHFSAVGPYVFKVLVAHHPFIPPEGEDDRAAVGRAELAIAALGHCGADLILAGHLHRGYSRQTASLGKQSILVAQSGSTLSDRPRDDGNSFNVVDVEADAVNIAVYVWEPERGVFIARPPLRYEKRGEWRRID